MTDLLLVAAIGALLVLPLTGCNFPHHYSLAVWSCWKIYDDIRREFKYARRGGCDNLYYVIEEHKRKDHAWGPSGFATAMMVSFSMAIPLFLGGWVFGFPQFFGDLTLEGQEFSWQFRLAVLLIACLNGYVFGVLIPMIPKWEKACDDWIYIKFDVTRPVASIAFLVIARLTLVGVLLAYGYNLKSLVLFLGICAGYAHLKRKEIGILLPLFVSLFLLGTHTFASDWMGGYVGIGSSLVLLLAVGATINGGVLSWKFLHLLYRTSIFIGLAAGVFWVVKVALLKGAAPPALGLVFVLLLVVPAVKGVLDYAGWGIGWTLSKTLKQIFDERTGMALRVGYALAAIGLWAGLNLIVVAALGAYLAMASFLGTSGGIVSSSRLVDPWHDGLWTTAMLFTTVLPVLIYMEVLIFYWICCSASVIPGLMDGTLSSRMVKFLLVMTGVISLGIAHAGLMFGAHAMSGW